MDDATLKEYEGAMEVFPSVWARVTGPVGKRPAPETDNGLSSLIQRELEAARRDRSLARGYPGRAGAVLNRHAATAAERAAALQAERFISEGKDDRPPLPPKKYAPGLKALRDAMLEDEKTARMYSDAPAQSDGQRELFSRGAQAASRAAKEKKALIRTHFKP